MQWCTPMILSFTLLWDRAILLQHYRILRFVAKISCPALTCLNVTQRRPKSFTSPHFLHRPSQFHFLIFFLKLFCLRNESWIHWRASSTTNISTREISCEQVLIFLRSVQLSLFLTQVTMYPSYFFITSHGMLVSLLLLACWCKFT